MFDFKLIALQTSCLLATRLGGCGATHTCYYCWCIIQGITTQIVYKIHVPAPCGIFHLFYTLSIPTLTTMVRPTVACLSLVLRTVCLIAHEYMSIRVLSNQIIESQVYCCIVFKYIYMDMYLLWAHQIFPRCSAPVKRNPQNFCSASNEEHFYMVFIF